MLSDIFMDEAYDMRIVAERELMRSWLPTSDLYKYHKMLRDADSLFDAAVTLKREGK